MADEARSLRQAKRETERTRAELTATVEQLRASVSETASDIRERISPSAIKAEVSGYIRSRGEQMIEDIAAAARNNPMQAVAVGAGVAYPLLRIARAIPMPVLMVGAGLFFAGSKSGQAAAKKATDWAVDTSNEAGRRAREIGDQLGQSASDAKGMVMDRVQQAKDTVSDGIDRLSGAAASSAQGLARGSASQAEGLQNSAGSAVEAGMDALKSAQARAGDIAGSTGRTISSVVEQHPLFVAGVGLLLGGLIASALPRSDIEDDLIGEASDSVKKRAQDAASEGFESARSAVGDIYENAAGSAEAEGLTIDGLGDAAKDIGQRVRKVAEASVSAAFDKNNDQHTPGEGKDHG